MVSLTGVALAYAPTGYAVVSFTQDNFDTLGSYTGTGSIITLDNEDVPPAPVTVLNTAISVADVQDAVDNDDLHDRYVIGTDPQEGVATVIDAIILIADANNLDIGLGWDSINGGAYIYDLANTATANAVDYYEGPNGNTWANSSGTGWSAAYSVNGGAMTPAASYLSNIPLGSGAIDIVFDLSEYSYDWDTGLVWPILP